MSPEAYSAKEAKNEGKKLEKEMVSKPWDELSNIPLEELQPSDQKGKVFDAKLAKKQIKDQNIPTNKDVEFINGAEVRKNIQENSLLDQNEYFLKKS
ncbi:MAG: hypothetical protein AB7E63_12715 [Parachlamydia sp.]